MKICVVKAGLQGRVCPILTFLRVVEEPEAITKPSAHASGGLPLLSELKGDCVHETTRNEGNLEWQSCIRKDLCRAYAQAPYIYIYIIVVISRQPMNRLKRYHRLGHVALLVEKNNWLDHVGSLGGYVC